MWGNFFPVGNRWGVHYRRPPTLVRSFKPDALAMVLSATAALWGGFLLVILKALRGNRILVAEEVETTLIARKTPQVLYALWRGRQLDV